MPSSEETLRSYTPVSQRGVETRAAFITRTYHHVMGAIVVFTLLEVLLFRSGAAETLARAMLGTSWLLVLGGFMLVTWLGTRAAHNTVSLPSQYLGLFAVVSGYAILFVPLLYIAEQTAPGVIQSAALVTLLGFAGLTVVAFQTRRDFSFLGSLLRFGGVVALVLIVASLLFGFHLGTWFSVGMVAFAGGAILYDTSNILHHYPEDRHVGAATELFSSVALLFWYVLRLFLSRD